MVEKGMDWKQAVVPTSTKLAVSAAPSPAQSTAPADIKLPSNGQCVLIFLMIYNYINFIYFF